MTSRPHAAEIRPLFDQAVEMSGLQRAAFLDQACEDAELRAAVASLLAAHDRAGAFLADPTIRVEQVFPGGALSVGSAVGPYRLVGVIGEGGFGTVFLAQQEQPLRRRVALKVIKPGMDTRQVIARFALERQALALMDHPNIARVFDAGTTDTGRPYFVMELVEGQPLTDYARAFRLGLRQRLNLFLGVCAAVHHAHLRGIVHRDLKPSNVLVSTTDGRPVPKVIDFGIAKALHAPVTSDAEITQQAQFLGTPQYMSPEQVCETPIDLDPRCDVYGLGVLLYELLTGLPPFDPARLQAQPLSEVRRVIREVDPPTPSTRLAAHMAAGAATTDQRQHPLIRPVQLRGDLDWIVMKALEKDRARRFDSAEALAADMARYLADRPVAARPPGLAYRISKYARRNRRVIAGIAAVLAAVAIIEVVTAWRVGIERQHAAAMAMQHQLSTPPMSPAAPGPAPSAEPSAPTATTPIPPVPPNLDGRLAMMRERTVGWFAENGAAQADAALVTRVTAAVDQHLDAGQDVTVLLGAGLMKSGHPGAMAVFNVQNLVFSLTADQAARLGLSDTGVMTLATLPEGQRLVPDEASLGTLVFDSPAPAHSAHSDLPSGVVSGHVNTRTTEPLPAGDYAFRLRCQFADAAYSSFCPLPQPPALGHHTANFTFSPDPAHLPVAGRPAVVFLDLCRLGHGADGARYMEVIANTMPAVTDLLSSPHPAALSLTKVESMNPKAPPRRPGPTTAAAALVIATLGTGAAAAPQAPTPATALAPTAIVAPAAAPLAAPGPSAPVAPASPPVVPIAPPVATTAPATQTGQLPPGWEQVDERMVFLTVQLASVESSLKAIARALNSIGFAESVRTDEKRWAKLANEKMDRNGGSPVPWQEFYGRTAQGFFYHPTGRHTYYINPVPISQRPPQFDYIYRANRDHEKQSDADIAALEQKVEPLLRHRRELESQQDYLWCKVSFRGPSSAELGSQPLYRFALAPVVSPIPATAPATQPSVSQRLAAANAACGFMRRIDRLVAAAQESSPTAQGKLFDWLATQTTAARNELTLELQRQAELADSLIDAQNPLGRLAVAARRLEDVSHNIHESFDTAAQADRANDDRLKDAARRQFQAMLLDYARTVMTADQCVRELAYNWQLGTNRASLAQNPDSGAPAPPAQPRLNTRESPPDRELAVLRTVDLLQLVDVALDKVSGGWSMNAGVLRADKAKVGRVQFAYQPPDEYDYRIVFTRTTGDGRVAQLGVADGLPFAWFMGMSNNTRFCFYDLAESDPEHNATAVVVEQALETGRSYTSVLKVRKGKVEAYLDDKLVARWTPRVHRVTSRNWVLKRHDVLGVGIQTDAADFTGAEVTELSGPGKILR